MHYFIFMGIINLHDWHDHSTALAVSYLYNDIKITRHSQCNSYN